MEMRTTPMSDIGFLPRVLVHKTEWGTKIEWHRGRGLFARDEYGRSRSLSPDQLRREFPLAWPAWVRWAAILPPDELVTSWSGPRGGAAA
jgi:hypothetical protein